MKIKKKLRSFRCADTLYSAVEQAAQKEEMSVNEWVLSAIRHQLKYGVTGEGIELDKLEGIAKANAMDKLTAAIQRTQSIFETTSKELGIELSQTQK